MEDKLINLEDMRSLFRKRLWIIIVVTALTTVLGIYKTRQMAPTYTGSMKFLVSTSDKILDNYSEDEIEAYSKFMATFNEIMKVGDFLDDTLKKNKISKTSDQVKYAISYSVSTTAPIFTLSYTSSSTNEMEDILNAVCEKFEYEIKEIDSRVKVKILEEPTTYSSLPNKAKVILVTFGNRRWPSTRSMPRGGGATSSRFLPMCVSFWGRWTSRMWIPSTDCPRPFPLTRRPPPRAPGPSWVR